MKVTRSHGAEAAFEILAKRRRDIISKSFWGHPEDCDSSLSVRATSYALMVYTERGEVLTEPIVDWINSMRKSGRLFANKLLIAELIFFNFKIASGWGSSIDTMVATEALVYWSMRYSAASETKDQPNDSEKVYFQDNLALEINSRGLESIFNYINLDQP